MHSFDIGKSGDLMKQGRHAVVVVPHDTTLLTRVPAILWVGVTGDITVLTAEGETVLFENVPVGWFDKILIQRVNATATTATNMVAVSG